MRIEPKAVDLVEDLLELAPPVRCAIALVLASGSAYYVVFGLLALAGIWRESLTNAPQLAAFLAVGSAQNWLSWKLSWRTVKAGVIAGLCWFGVALIPVLVLSNANDLPDCLLFPLVPLAFCVLNAPFFERLLLKLDLRKPSQVSRT